MPSWLKAVLRWFRPTALTLTPSDDEFINAIRREFGDGSSPLIPDGVMSKILSDKRRIERTQLRDIFAGHALSGLLASSTPSKSNSTHRAQIVAAYEIADALLKVRDEKPNDGDA